MKRIAIAIHGGASQDSDFIRQNKTGYEEGLKAAVQAGYAVLQKGGSAIDAVERAVNCLEDNPLFNAGRGSALNNQGKVEMDAAIMDGENLKAGAVAMVKSVKNPISLAKKVLEKTSHVLLCGYGALKLAKEAGIVLEEDQYFITGHQLDEFKQANLEETGDILLKKQVHGTVGAVALDEYGNIAAATSTGGTPNSLPGRVGDSCMIGAGCYADNRTCAISATGDGEYIITGVIANTISLYTELTGKNLQEACDYVIKERNKDTPGDMGVISINKNGEIGITFNCERMHRAWIDTNGNMEARIYK
ncbi:MAG: Beta-aspartyl-peptidase [Mucilaginibacter sp.]|nr:Beta-aspartyl-peptidase [Mucilaginibacter sp.]